LKERITYEIIDPKKIGLTESKIILGKTSGRHALKQHLEDMGYVLDDEEFEKVFVRFKELADKKAEITDDDLGAIMADEVRAITSEVYGFESLRVTSGTDEVPNATVKLTKNGAVIKKTAEGDGPVDAACNAIGKATGVSAKLLFYNVSSITGGLDAQGDVTIQLDIGGKKVLGRGVSTDIIEASARAYLNAINKSLTK